MTDLINPLFQKIFMVEETTAGTLVFPSDSTSCIIGAGYIECETNINYTDSPEIRPSLNLRDQVKDRDSAGSWSLPILVRPNGVDTVNYAIKNPMGDLLFKCLQGKKAAFTAATGAVTNVATTVNYTTLSGDTPQKAGVIHLSEGANDELVYYDGITMATATTGSFNNCVRGYGGTTPFAVITAGTVALASPTYTQGVDRPSFSLWYEQDGIIFFARGATVSEMNLKLENKGYPIFELNGGIMSKGRAGQSTMASYTGGSASPAVLTLGSGEAGFYSLGARVYNITKDDHQTGAGYEVTVIDTANDQITLESCTISWDPNDKIGGYLPADLVTGTTLQAEDSQIKINDIAKKPTAFNVKIAAEIQYIEDEITPDGINDYVAKKRAITGSTTQLFKNTELSLFADAESDTRKSLLIRLGDGTAGMTCFVWLRRCNFQVPKLSTSEPLVSIELPYHALDENTEDSCAIIFV